MISCRPDGVSARSAVPAGFTLVEVIIALVLLGLVALATGTATARLASAGSRDGQALVAVDLLDERLERIQGDPGYARLEARYGGTESEIPLFPGFRRTTTITRVREPLPNGRELEYKVVDVVVEGPALAAPVRRTITVALP